MEKCEEFLESFSDEKQFFKREDIFKLLDLIIEDYGLSNFGIKKESFVEERTLGMYVPKKRTVYINFEQIRIYHGFLLNEVKEDGRASATPLSYNVNIYHILLHEVNHARQHYNHLYMPESNLKKVIDECMEMGLRSPDSLTFREKIIYRLFYFCVLTERNAEIEALRETINFLKNTKYSCMALKDYFENEEQMLSKQGYENGSCPFYKYYFLKNKLFECRNYNFDDVSYDDVISWGLPIKGVTKKLF